MRNIFILLVALFTLGFAKNVLAEESISVLYVPLIGITSVPEPLALPSGAGNITYNYAVKNFLHEGALNDIQVVDDKCSPVKFVEGDDNADSKLDYSETWRYRCTTRLSETTQSVATVTGHSNNINATHKAYATVVVGNKNPAPLVSIINITKVAYPLSLPPEGGSIVFTYKVNNPGVAALSDVSVTDDKCKTVSSRLGDTNGNSLLDINEVWIYTCSTTLTETTTNTVKVSAYANGLRAVDEASMTVKVEAPPLALSKSPGLPNAGGNPSIKNIVWMVLSGLLIVLIIVWFLIGKSKRDKVQKSLRGFRRR